MGTTSPTCQPFLSATVSRTSTFSFVPAAGLSSRPSVALALSGSPVYMRVIVLGSTATRVWARPAKPHCPARTSDTASTPSTLRSLSATAGGRPPAPPVPPDTPAAVTEKSARMVSDNRPLRRRLHRRRHDRHHPPTRVIPIMSAPAVAAVRRGSRMAFSRPSDAGWRSKQHHRGPQKPGRGTGHQRQEHGGTQEDAGDTCGHGHHGAGRVAGQPDRERQGPGQGDCDPDGGPPPRGRAGG